MAFLEKSEPIPFVLPNSELPLLGQILLGKSIKKAQALAEAVWGKGRHLKQETDQGILKGRSWERSYM